MRRAEDNHAEQPVCHDVRLLSNSGDRMRRRDLLMLVGAGGAFWSIGATAQNDDGPLIGLLRLAPGDPTDVFAGGSLRPSMRKLGWEEGRNFRALILSADGGEDGLLRAAQELVAIKLKVVEHLGPQPAAHRAGV